MQPPFPVENTPLDWFRCIGELVSILGAVYFFIKGVSRVVTGSVFCRIAFWEEKNNINYQTYSPHPQIVDFKRKPPRIKSMYIDGFNEISL